MITRSDKVRIIEAITTKDFANPLREVVLKDAATREEVEEFLGTCFMVLMTAEGI